MAPPVAVVTGASSGIGLALVHYLVRFNWNVVMADIMPPCESIPGTIFVRTDVSSWDQQASLFQRAYEWQGRLDFCALNAGIDDRDDIFTKIAEPPTRPSMRTFEVNLIGAYYGIRLASHYMTLPSTEAGKMHKGGKIVLTGSGASIWPLPILPQYTATKHALVGLGRSIGRSEGAKQASVRVTVLCPAVVATGFPPPGVLDAIGPEQLTPMETLLRAYDQLADLQNGHLDDWVNEGPTGAVLEANGDQLIDHNPPPRSSDGAFPTPEAASGAFQAFKERVESYARGSASWALEYDS